MYSAFKNFLNLGVLQATGMLLQLFTIPIITTNYGLSIFGNVALSTSVGLFFANLVNYGTNQTDVKDVSIYRNDRTKLSNIFSYIFFLRLLVFILITLILSTVIVITKTQYLRLWFSILPIIACEIFNPMYFLVGIEKIHWITIGNIVARALSLALIFLVHVEKNIPFSLNLMLSIPFFLFNIVAFFFLIRKFNLIISFCEINELQKKIKDNFYVTVNGSSVLLQQSIFMLAVSGVVTSSTLGAYGIIDKLLGSFRQIVSAFSTAIYPKAAQLFHEGKSNWIILRKKVQIFYMLLFFLIALSLLFFANHLSILLAHKEDLNTTLFLRYFSFAPLIMALNANNVLELLLEKHYKKMFNISLVIIFSTGVISYMLTKYFSESVIGLYPLIIESVCLVTYTLFIRFKIKKSFE